MKNEPVAAYNPNPGLFLLWEISFFPKSAHYSIIFFMTERPAAKIRYLAASSGMVGTAVMGLGMLLTALAYRGVESQRYSLTNHFVSELGELGVSEWAPVFNWSLIIGGILTTIFMIYLASQIDHWLKYPLGLISVFSTINGALVGVYPMNDLEPHIRVAMRFFNLGMLTTFLYSLVFLFNSRHPFPRWLAIPGFVNALTFAWFLYFPAETPTEPSFDQGMAGLLTNRPDYIPLALLEWVVILGILFWVFLLAVYLLRLRAE